MFIYEVKKRPTKEIYYEKYFLCSRDCEMKYTTYQKADQNISVLYDAIA